MAETSCFPLDRQQLGEFCRRWHIRKLALFGSVVRGELRPDSDIDVLVEFEPGQVIGLKFVRIQEELSRFFGGRRVDLVTEKFLSHWIRDSVLAEAQVQYAEG
ncbi:MAG: nucleotidyltransferase family protein [Candidatus Riflebacteria bacterium]|nr:nucleotidyltransferase family protein [Candidatus Riflebacteria bacterium]